jgi:hypothetical protein
MSNELDPKDLDRLKVELIKYAEEGATDDDMRLFRESFIGEIKKKSQKTPSIPTFSTSLEEVIQPSVSGAKEIAQSPLKSNLKSEIPTFIDPTKPLKTKEVIDINAEKKPFDSEVIREQRKQRMGTHSSNLMAAIIKEPDLYTKKASTSNYGTQFVPETPNIENISKAIDAYAEKIKRTTNEDITTYDKQYLVNSIAEQVKQRKNIAEAAANASLRAINRKELPLYAYTGVSNDKGEVLTKGLFQEANEKIVNEQNKEVNNYKINSENLTNKVALEVAPEVNALKLDAKSKSELLNQEVSIAFNKSFEEKDKALYAQYNQLVQSGQMTPEVANGALKIKREELQKQTQDEVTAAYAPKFDQLNKEVNLKSKDIQSRYNRNYLAKANLLKEATDKRLQEIAQKNMVNMPKGYIEKWGKDFQESLAEIDKKNINQAYLDAKNTPMAARMSKAITAGFGDVLGSIGGAMSFAGLDASAINDVVIKTAMQNELASGAYYQIKDEESKAKGNKYENFGEKLLDPSWWIDNGVRSVPFMLATMPVGIAAGYGTGTLAKMLGASKRAAAISSAVGGGAVSWYGEATLEAGSAFNDALKQGYSEKDAAEIAARTYKNNLSTLPLSVFQMMPVFSKAFNFTKAFAMETVLGGAEEILQGWSQAEANAAANGQDVSLFEYAKTPQALEEGAIGAAMSSGMSLFALDSTPNIDKQISVLMSSISVGGEQHARAVLDIMNKNKAITDAQYKEANLQIDYILNGIESVQNFNVDDNLKAGLIGKFAKIGRAKAMLTDDENDLASQAAKEMIAEQEKEIKEILKGNTPLYLVFEKGNPIPTAASKEDFIAILKDPKLREQFTLQAINDDRWQSQVDKVYKTEKPTEEIINAEQEIIPTTETPTTPISGVSGEVQESGAVEVNIADRSRKDLFPNESRFANEVGQSGENSQISSYKEVNGIGLSEYSNPKNGLVDVIMTGTSDNDYVGYIRIYENGKPTNRWTSKMSNKSGNKGNFKTMITEAQKLLPEGHEYTETTNISLDGLRVYANSLSRDYEIATDEDGKPITNNVELNNATLAALQGAKNQQETEDLFDTKRGITRDEFNQIKEQVNKLLPNTRLLFDSANGIVTIQLPVLKSTKKQKTTNEQQNDKESNSNQSNANEANGQVVLEGVRETGNEDEVGKSSQQLREEEVVKPLSERIADLRAAEKDEYAALKNPTEKAKKKIYDKYDKLITPLIREQKAESKPIPLPTEDKSKEIALQKEIERKDNLAIEVSAYNRLSIAAKNTKEGQGKLRKINNTARDLGYKVTANNKNKWNLDVTKDGKKLTKSKNNEEVPAPTVEAKEFAKEMIRKGLLVDTIDLGFEIADNKQGIADIKANKDTKPARRIINALQEAKENDNIAYKEYDKVTNQWVGYNIPLSEIMVATNEIKLEEYTEKEIQDLEDSFNEMTKELTQEEINNYNNLFENENETINEGTKSESDVSNKSNKKEKGIAEIELDKKITTAKEQLEKAKKELQNKYKEFGVKATGDLFGKPKQEDVLFDNEIADDAQIKAIKPYKEAITIAQRELDKLQEPNRREKAIEFDNKQNKLDLSQKETVQKTEQTKKVVKALNIAEVEAVAKALAKEESKQGKTEAKNARKTEAAKSIKETENAKTILAIANNLDAIRAKLLENGNIKTIDCKWG